MVPLGALFPPQSAWWGLKWVMLANPLTYGVSGFHRALWRGHGGGGTLAVDFGISCSFAAGLFAIAALVARRDSAADWQ